LGFFFCQTTVDRKNLFKVDAGGKMVPVDVKDLEGKVVGLYFSASWCPPCKRFTPVLAEAYKHLQKDGKPFEVVFVSLDNDPNAYANYLRAMPWLAVPYGTKFMLSSLCFESVCACV
jgi:thiol-disulfide isomerase/thioredoxin